LLEIAEIDVSYGNIQALFGVSLNVGEGEIVILLGPNGAGKTTTLKSILGLLKPLKGKIKFMGEDITGKSPPEVVKRGISIVPEGRHIFPKLTVWENLLTGAHVRKDNKGINRDLEYIFSIFPKLEERKKQFGGTLSGGEQQMLAFGRALMSKPKLLLLDEPLMGLAPAICEDICKVMKEINKQGTSILLVEQGIPLFATVSQKGYILETGRIKFEGTADQLKNNEEIIKSYFGGG